MEKFECIKCKENEVKEPTICTPCIRKIIEEAKEIKRDVFLATKAYHLLGDISRGTLDICSVNKETEDYYIGHWLQGFGFIGVVFPKETTRKAISREETEEFVGYYGVSGLFEKIEAEALLGKVDYSEHLLV